MADSLPFFYILLGLKFLQHTQTHHRRKPLKWIFRQREWRIDFKMKVRKRIDHRKKCFYNLWIDRKRKKLRDSKLQSVNPGIRIANDKTHAVQRYKRKVSL